jgi:hypothetical protein
MRCANCDRELPANPTELEEIIECRFCDAVLCSAECARDHEDVRHHDDAEAVPDDDAIGRA